MLSRPTGYFFPLSGCVLREPSGHNLMHPTTWCPPNKWWVSTCQIYGKMWLPVGEKAALSILLSLNSTSLPPPANPGYRDGLYPHRLMADKIPLTETAVYSYPAAKRFNIYCCSPGKSDLYQEKGLNYPLAAVPEYLMMRSQEKCVVHIVVTGWIIIYGQGVIFGLFLFVVWMFLSYLCLNWMICIL